MNTEEFFAVLKKIHNQFEWTLTPDTDCCRGWQGRSHLRGVLKAGSTKAAFDPLGAVCYARTGKVCGPKHWPDAGEALGMAPVDSAELSAASCDRIWDGPEEARKPLVPLQEIRMRLIEVLNPMV